MTDLFYLENNKIKLNKYHLIIRTYTSLEKENYKDTHFYVNDDGLYELEVNYVPKHRLIEIIFKEEIDVSQYSWMEGIELKTENRSEEIEEIFKCGSLDVYNASLPEFADNYLLEIEGRLAILELDI